MDESELAAAERLATSRRLRSARRREGGDVSEDRAVVTAEQCWGCNRLRIPKPWASRAMLALLQSEHRLRFTEYLCNHDDCPANNITNGSRHR